MARALYSYTLLNIKEHPVLSIEDLNGKTSLTNDIENVVKEISLLQGINPFHYLIIYRDSEGMWDGWDHNRESFILLSQPTREEAIDLFINHVKSKQ